MSRNHVELDTELAVELPFVVAGPVLLQQVLLNLIMNAIEAMSSVNDRPRKLTILSQRLEAPAAVQVIVRDNGIGLDAVNSDRVFDPFYTSKPQGMGMGLSICRTIIAAHGGQLTATANTGHGASFQFLLPVGAKAPRE